MKNRVLLNIICIFLIIVSCVGIGLVVHDVRTGETVDKEASYPQEQDNNMPGGDRQPMMNEGEEPPAKPDGEMENGERPEGMCEMPQGSSGERPEMPDGEMGKMPEEGMQGNVPEEMVEEKEIKFSALQILITVACSIVAIICVAFMVVTKLFSKNIFNDKDKVIITILVGIILGGLVSVGIILLGQNVSLKDDEFYVDRGETVNSKKINLDDYDSNVTITESGEYTLTGSFKYSVLVETDDKVVLNLNGVNIEANNTAAIANINTNELVINLVDDTVNTIKDGGSGDYDGCLYSKGPLTIQGDGTLNVYGNQEDGEGIATTDNDITINSGIVYVESTDDGLNAGGDGGTITINGGIVYIKAGGDGIDSNGNLVINGGTVYAMGSSTGGDSGLDADLGIAINGGTVIALGSDMLEPPTSSKQKYIALTLNSTISKGELITLLNEDEELVVSFEADENFKTIIISSDELETGTYYLYQGGKNTGTKNNQIYSNGKYTKGDLVKEITLK